jgi:zinc protease
MNCVRRIHRPARAGWLLCCLAWLAAPAWGANSPPVPRKIVAIEGITEYRLDNGLRILLFPDQSTPNVTVNLTVFVGSRHEGYGETGMAHLLEHMLFKGTPQHRDIPRALKEHGARYNGSTWLDRTNYYETMPGTGANLEFALRLEADRLVHSFIKREDLASEMTVVRNEFEAGENSPEMILSQRMMAVAYEWHNYGKNTIGNRSDIERVPIDRLQAFYRKHYQPDNVMLVVAGKFEPARALALIGKYFGPLKRPTRKLDDTYTEEPPQDGERTVVLRRVGKVGMVGVLYHVPSGSHEDFPAVKVLTRILASEPSGRLYKALVETKKATSVSGSATACHDPGVLEIAASVNPENSPENSLEAVRDTTVGILEKLGSGDVTVEEVDRARRQILKARELLMTQSNQIGVELSEWAAQGDWRLFFLYRDRVAKVTPADVKRVAAAYLRRSNRTVGLYIPSPQVTRTPIPPSPDVAALVKDYKGSQTVAAGEAFEPTPENIEKRVQRSQLPSGLKLALLPRKTRGGAVAVELSLHYGNEKSLKDVASATQFLAEMLTRGTKKHTRQQIEDELDRLGARLEAEGVLGDLNFTIVTRRDNLAAVLNLVGEMLRQPTFPAGEFDVLKRGLLDGLEKQLVEPTALASRLLRRRLNPYPADDIRYVPTIEESMARARAVTREQVVKLYAEQLGGQFGELAVVGDFDPEAVRRQAETLLGDWKSAVPYRRIPRPAPNGIKGGREKIHTPDKANAIYLAALLLPLTDTDPEFPAVRLASYLFGEGALSSRLANRVRQKEGLSYGVGSQFSADSQDRSARFMMFAICNPANITKVNTAIREELEKLLKDGLGEAELAEAKKGYLQQLKLARSSDTSLAGLLAHLLYLDRKFTFYTDLEKKVAALTPQDVSRTFKKYVAHGKLVIVHAGDFASKPAKPKKGK